MRSVCSAAPMPRMRRAMRGASATFSGGSFSLADATALGGSSGEKMRFFAALSTESVQAAASASDAKKTVRRASVLKAAQVMCAARARQPEAVLEIRSRMQSLKDKLLKAGLVTAE